MLNLNRPREKYGSFICRRCLNKAYRAKLEPKDCRYGYYYTCPKCHKDHHIVVDLTFTGHVKMLFK